MPSFDIASKVDVQALDNAVNNTKKEITTRYDFKDAYVIIDLNKKDFTLHIETDDDMKMGQILDLLLTRAVKQNIQAQAFDLSKESVQSGKYVKKEIKVINGLEQEVAKKINKAIKSSGMKVQSQIMDDFIRVTGKKIDDLQAIIKFCETNNFSVPLQFVNMRS
ncbi:MAG: YajQ family cyclic di-GMP-binding protein [Chitinophagaceae bacterium]